MIDNVLHFKSSALVGLVHRLRDEQAFVPVYTPSINSTVERVNRDILQVLRVLLIELKLDTRNWPRLLRLTHSNLNHILVQSLGGCAPIHLFTDVSSAGFASWCSPRSARATFPLGTTFFGGGSTNVFAQASFSPNLLTRDKFDVHGSRLKFFHDLDLNIAAEQREHVSLKDLVLEVRSIVGHHFGSAPGEWQVLVAWRRLQGEENSWEPLGSIVADIPELVSQYVTQQFLLSSSQH
ncbi:hypothetical protein PybrP1_002125 [[Pythium] brassicae (nom. inval.)]|nr:hypothetical protein PybrP1_002125 [[Pythium] brassicae (nom. inval.)]